jgi:four helix bundle protein
LSEIARRKDLKKDGDAGFDLRVCTRQYALAIVRFYAGLPKATEVQVLGKQMLRSGTSAGAHYHEGCRAKSQADFISKLEGGLQELEETSYWLELLADLQLRYKEQISSLLLETNELTAIFVTMVKKVKANFSRS